MTDIVATVLAAVAAVAAAAIVAAAVAAVAAVAAAVATDSMGMGMTTIVVSLSVCVTGESESVRSTREEDFVDDVDNTITRNDILTEGLSVGICCSFVHVDIDNKVPLRLELVNSENIVGNTNSGLQPVDNISRTKLLRTRGIDAPSLRSLVVSSALVRVDRAVRLSASKITGQSSLRKNVKFNKSLLIDSGNQTINLGEGGISRSEDCVRRVSSRQ
mmetsp:Transcript_11805/g.24391  ORF Transcript_11805/g.24391 Transcript_11805/m.24391 type:complete len:217 (-) Transcript_11805:398-1048(-)